MSDAPGLAADGDHIGVGAVGDRVWAGFPDTSNGQTSVVAAIHVAKAP